MFLYFKKAKTSIHQAFIIIKDSLKRTVSINLKQIIKEKTNCNKNYSPQFAFVLSQRTGQPQSQEPRSEIQNNNNWQPKRQQRPAASA